MIDRTLNKRLASLEARMTPAVVAPLSMTIHFIDPKKGVTSSLLVGSGQYVWTNPVAGATSKNRFQGFEKTE